MTNLSKQIFECCGVEPRYFYTIETRCEFVTFGNEQSEGTQTHYNLTKSQVSNYKAGSLIGYGTRVLSMWVIEVRKEFPDLETNANNKLKLIDVIRNCNLLVTFGKDFCILEVPEQWYWQEEDVQEIFSEKGLLETIYHFLNGYRPDNKFENESDYFACWKTTIHDRPDLIEKFESLQEQLKQAIANEQWEW